MTSVYRNLTVSAIVTKFSSFILKSNKCNFLFTLLHRAFKHCSNFEHFHWEIDKLKTIKLTVTPKVLFISVSKSVFYKKGRYTESLEKSVLPFLGKKSMQLRTCLVDSIESNLKFCKLKFIFQSPCQLNSLFR